MNKITIIIPVYNAESIIQKTLERLEKQTFKEFEIILINDGSNDKTLLKIKNYLKKSSLKVIILNQINRGVARARNRGIELLNTKYVIFLDSDDFWDINALEVMYNQIEKTQTDLICSSYARISLDGKILNQILYKEKELINEEILKEFLLKNVSPGIGNALIKVSIIKENQIKYYDYKYGEDNLFFREILLYSKKMKIIEDVLFYYVNNPSSVMNRTYNTDRLDALKSIHKFISKYKNNNLIVYANILLLEEIYGLLKINSKLIFSVNIPKVKLDMIKESKNINIKIIWLILKLPKFILYLLYKI